MSLIQNENYVYLKRKREDYDIMDGIDLMKLVNMFHLMFIFDNT